MRIFFGALLIASNCPPTGFGEYVFLALGIMLVAYSVKEGSRANGGT